MFYSKSLLPLTGEWFAIKDILNVLHLYASEHKIMNKAIKHTQLG